MITKVTEESKKSEVVTSCNNLGGGYFCGYFLGFAVAWEVYGYRLVTSMFEETREDISGFHL